MALTRKFVEVSVPDTQAHPQVGMWGWQQIYTCKEMSDDTTAARSAMKYITGGDGLVEPA